MKQKSKLTFKYSGNKKSNCYIDIGNGLEKIFGLIDEFKTNMKTQI